MLDPHVMRITLVYAEKVKFISFTFQRSNEGPWNVRSCGTGCGIVHPTAADLFHTASSS